MVSIETKVWRSHSEELIRAIGASDPQGLAAKLFSRCIIEGDTRDELSLPMTASKQARIIVTAVEKRIDSDPNLFHQFVEVLKGDGDHILRAKGEKLSEACRGQSVPTTTATGTPQQASAGPKPLSDPPNFEDLMDEVAAALPKKWEDVATKLGLPQTEIDRIESIQNPTPNRYYRQVFNYWKKNKPKPYCWATVVEALKSRMVDESGLASDLESRIR